MDLLEEIRIEDLDEEQKQVATLIGMDGYRKLVRHYNGLSIYIPKVERLEKVVRDERIKQEFDGSNYKELAKKYGLTETWIRSIVFSIAKEIKARPIDGQMSILDYNL